jgi:hypothetical protein
VLALCVVYTPTASAARFWLQGKITRTLADAVYGGCMVHLDVHLPAPCPASGWVSLDCDGVYYGAIDGNNKFASVLTALSLDLPIGIYVNDEIKHNGYCVARRVDIIGS